MKSVGQVVADRPASTYRQSASTKLKPIDHSQLVDRALFETRDLIQDENYKKWFASRCIKLGVDRYLGLAKDAREGKQPGRLFVFLLKRAS